MRFNILIIILMLISMSGNASELDQEEMFGRAQAVYERSIEMQYDGLGHAAPNQYADQFNDRIEKISSDGNHIIKQYLEGKASSKQTANLFVFVSFSMPDELIKQYMNEASRYGASVVIIGLIDNDFMQTQLKIQELTEKSRSGGIQIDPNLFTRYEIKSVPAILLTEDEYPCQPSACAAKAYDMIYGAVPIKYALESFEASGDLKESASTRIGMTL